MADSDPDAPITVRSLEVGLLNTNCYLVKGRDGAIAVVDPGGDPERIVDAVEALEGSVAFILCTHGHLDHVEAAGEVRERTGGTIVLHRNDLVLWERLDLQAQLFQLPPPPPLPPPDRLVADGERLEAGSLAFDVLHVPGHSPGSVGYLCPEVSMAFTGDVVFSMGVGRTDLWGGDPGSLRASLETRIFSLPDSFLLYPGHGPPVSVREARRNRYLLDFF